MSKNKDSIVIYESEKGEIEFRADVEKDTIWATQEKIANLFDCERSVITKHLQNVFNDLELDENSVCANFAHTATDGKKYKVKHYNLDAIIAVGYRVSSKKATQFRIWATKTLRQHLIGGYSLNNYKLEKSPKALLELYKAMALIDSTGAGGKLKGKVTIRLTEDFDPSK